VSIKKLIPVDTGPLELVVAKQSKKKLRI
jgi:hypothetical protein